MKPVYAVILFVACTTPVVHNDIGFGDESFDTAQLKDVSDINASDTTYPDEITDDLSTEPDGSDNELAILDCNKDSDMDGVFDCDEQAAGTNPFDPTDAPAWHPEIQGYPRLFFGPKDVDTVKKDLLSLIQDPSVSDLMQKLKANCGQTPPKYPKDLYNPYVEDDRAAIAKSCAFLAFVNGDKEAADKALNLLNGIQAASMEDFTGIDLNSPYYSKWDIVDAQAVESYLVAFDLLAAAGMNWESNKAKDRVKAFCDAYFDFGTKGPERFLLTASQNNHAIKFGSAVTMCGLMFNHRKQAALYVDFGVTFVDFLLDYLIDTDGGDAEGPNYNIYASVNYLPMFAAYHRLVGKDRTYKPLSLLRLKPPKEDSVLVRDFSRSPRMLKNNDWMLNLLMPDGQTPNIDDANLATPFAGLVAGVFHDPRYLYALMKKDGRYRLEWGDYRLLPESLCTLAGFRGQQPFVPQKMLVMSSAGEAVFRGKTDSYMLVLAEQGKAVKHGGGHEQMDPTQWLYFALGEYLVIDSGYISWEDRDFVAHPKNHNMVLVDGQGPDDGPLGRATEGFFDTWDEHHIRTHTGYRGCRIKRDYYFFDTTAAVVTSVDCDKPHELSNLVHLNAGGDTGIQVTDQQDLTLFKRPGVNVTMINTCVGGHCSYTRTTDFHGFHHGKKHSHQVVAASTSDKKALFFNVIFTESSKVRTTLDSGRSEHGLCYLDIGSDKATGVCYCDTDCSISTNNYVVTGGKGLTWFTFDPNTLKVLDFYGSKSPLLLLQPD